MWALKKKSLAWPAIFKNTKESPKNTKENQQLICFANFFLLNEVINLIPWQVIYIFPYLSIDTQLVHIYGHLAIWRNGHYGLTIYGKGYGQVGSIFKGTENRRSPVKELNW